MRKWAVPEEEQEDFTRAGRHADVDKVKASVQEAVLDAQRRQQ